VNHDLGQRGVRATIRNSEKQQATAKRMSPKRAAAPVLALVFHPDRDPEP